MKKQLLLIFLICFSFILKAQNNEPSKAIFSTKVTSMKHVTSIASRPGDQRLVEMTSKEAQDGKYKTKNIPNLIIGKDPQKTNDYFTLNPNSLEQKIKGRATELVIEGAESSSQPTDAALAVGPNHVILVFNTGFRIFDKSGNPLTTQLAPDPTIFPNSGCCDLTASYDNLADRWVLTYLGSGMQVAVSDGPDPVNDGWYIYNISEIDDYNKLSVWHDGYYVTNNGDPDVVALERSKMLTGDASAQVIGFNLPGMATSGFNSSQAFNISDDNHPTGDVGFVYMQDDAWAGVSNDHIKVWTLNMDWASGNGTMSSATEITTTPFISVFDGGSWDNLQQPSGVSIDALQSTIMNQAQFRKFSNHNSALFNFVVNTDVGGKLAGIRWIELRQTDDNAPWTLYQEGTYTSPNGKHAWNASLIMDYQGNIGMGYSGMGGSNNKHVGMYYTGRFANDPLGTMTIAEEIILEGDGDIPGTRYGDYSKIDVDPSDDKTFWFADEMISSTRKDIIGVFSIAPDFTNDLGVVSIDTPISGILTNTETVTVTIFNFGTDQQTNFPVSLVVDGTTIATENFTGTLDSATSAQFTFSQMVDLSTVGNTYVIEACTNLSTDEENGNNCKSSNVENLEPNDIGVTAITSPTSSTSLGNAEQITVTITNFGGAEQSNFEVSYTLDGTTVTENVAGPLAASSEMTYTFSQTGDFSTIGTYTLMSTTLLPTDSDNSNDASTVSITKNFCEPVASCGSGDGLYLFQVSTIDNTSDCSTNGYSSYTDLVADFNLDTTYPLTITTNYGTQYVRVWIDFNDDSNFSLDELVVDNYLIADGQSSGAYTETMDLVIPASINAGSHIMRAKTNWNSPVPDDACEDTSYGETEDYTANVIRLFDDVGITSIDTPISSNTLSNSETVTVTVFNYGENAQTNFPISLVVDGSTIATENFAGTIDAATSAQFTFTQTIDLSTVGNTYVVEVCTNLSNDEESNNNCNTSNITHLFSDDIGITAITAPISSETLGNAEQITVTITNFGGAEQTSFDVSYTLDGTTITESISDPLAGNSEMIYTFMQSGDFSAIGAHDLMATTLLSNDSDLTNDSMSVTIIKNSCEPTTNCNGDGIRLFQVSTIDNTSDCGTDGYSNFTNLIADFNTGTTYPLTITTPYGNQFVRVWIDFNDDSNFDANEIVVDNYEIADGQGSGTYTETMDLIIPNGVNAGMHIMRAKTNWNNPVPDDACENTSYGETEDYSANITDTASTNNSLFDKTNFNVSSLNDNQFILSVKTTEVNERLALNVYNMVGQKLLNRYIENENGEYRYELDMSHAASGVYVVTLGNTKLKNSKRIIVK